MWCYLQVAISNMEQAMDHDIQARFDELDKRLATTDKRFDDIKWYMGGFATFVTFAFGLLTILMSWNFSNERTSLREFQRDLRADLGKVEVPPELELLGVDGSPLANQELEAQFDKDKDGNSRLVINHFLRNTGNSLTGPMYVKIYASEPIRLGNRSTDEPKFKFETPILPSSLDPSEIPGKYATEWWHKIYLHNQVMPGPGKYPMLVKVFYGKGKVVQAPFILAVSQQ
jgi:hypothetical protein